MSPDGQQGLSNLIQQKRIDNTGYGNHTAIPKVNLPLRRRMLPQEDSVHERCCDTRRVKVSSPLQRKAIRSNRQQLIPRVSPKVTYAPIKIGIQELMRRNKDD
jgi:hypothetical protein